MFSDFANIIVALNRVSKNTFGYRPRLGKVIAENLGYLLYPCNEFQRNSRAEWNCDFGA